MSDFIISQIRTYVPILVGGLVSWLTVQGVDLDAETQAGLIIALTGLLQAAYYFLARVAENRWPQAGVLLGSTKKPEYYE